MPVQLNHTIIWCRDKQRSAEFLVRVLGLPPPIPFGPMLVVPLENGVSVDFYDNAENISVQHYAFLVTEPEFDAIYERIRAQDLMHWADPARSQPGTINHFFGGRGVYFEDPDKHFLEVITRPYDLAAFPGPR